MIERKIAESQARRLSHLRGYPNSPEGIRDFVSAIEAAGSKEDAESVISAFVDGSTAGSECPTAADVRRVVNERLTDEKECIERCGSCNGSGFRTVYKLVTYRAGTFKILRAETLDLGYEPMLEFQKNLNADQAILSAAKPCICLPATHKTFTGRYA